MSLTRLLQQLMLEFSRNGTPPCASKELAQAYRGMDLRGFLSSLPGEATDVSWGEDDVPEICKSMKAWDVLSRSLMMMGQSGGFVGRKAVGEAPQTAPSGAEEKIVYQHRLDPSSSRSAESEMGSLVRKF